MRLYFKDSCIVAIVLPDGTRTSVGFRAGDFIVPSSPVCFPSWNVDITTIDIDIDGAALINVPLDVLEEKECVGC
jgi:hypothetical protein